MESSQQNSRPIHFVSQGEGQPVVLLHGITASLCDWVRLLPDLERNGYQGIALDLLGHGESWKPDEPDQYTIETIYASFAEWIDGLRLERPAVLVGHSMGGYLSLRYSVEHPDRVCALVLINPLYTVEQLSLVLQLARRRPDISERALRHTPEWLMNAILGWDPSKAVDFTEEARRQIANDYKRASPHVVYVTRDLPDLTTSLPQVTCPTLVIWGDEDLTLDPRSFPRLVEHLPNGSSRVIHGCGHQPHIGKPGLVNQLTLDFLASLELAVR